MKPSVIGNVGVGVSRSEKKLSLGNYRMRGRIEYNDERLTPKSEVEQLRVREQSITIIR